VDEEPYEVLGVSHDASQKEIKEAYRQKARDYHPDVCEREDATEMFKRVKNAYEKLHSGDKDTTEPEQTAQRTPSGNSTQSQRTTRKQRGETQTNEKSKGGDSERASQKSDRSEPGFGKDGFDTFETYDDGWKLARNGDGEWFVFTETETAPHLDEKTRMYLDKDGGMSTVTVHFDTRESAQETYKKGYSYRKAEKNSSTEATDPSRRKTGASSGGNGPHVYKSKDMDGSFTGGNSRWGELNEKYRFDRLWKLCYKHPRTRVYDVFRNSFP